MLALSGAQVALVAALLASGLRAAAGRPLGRRRASTALAVVAYAGFVGGDVPVVARRGHGGGRAARAGARPGRGRREPARPGGARCCSPRSPSSVADVGFQLSFGATLAILLLVAAAHARPAAAAAAPRPGARGLGGGPGALAPLLALHFHRLAPAALLLNLAAVPLSGAVLLAGFARAGARAARRGRPLAGDLAWLAARALLLSGDLGPCADWLDVRVPAPRSAVLVLHVAGLGLRAARPAGAGPRGRSSRGHVALVLGPLGAAGRRPA